MNLNVHQVSKTFSILHPLLMVKRGEVRAVQNIDFSLKEGGSLGIVGESGSGKTTLAKILAGLLKPDKGDVYFNDIDYTRLADKKKSSWVQMVFQDPFASLNPKLLLRTQLVEAFSGDDGANIIEQTKDMMASVGLPVDYLYRYPHQLSGGQRQRFSLCRALAKKPKILIADEPVSSLDLSVQAQIINLLNSLREKMKFTLIVVSHDLGVIAQCCEEMIIMKNGKIIEKGTVESLLSSPQETYSKELLAAYPTI
ncbi:MAG: ABC transporter ATP-binding protein [Elusimicrobiota bacterium]